MLTWSMTNTLACGAIVTAGDIAPVREMHRHREDRMSFDFFIVDTASDQVDEILDDPEALVHRV